MCTRLYFFISYREIYRNVSVSVENIGISHAELKCRVSENSWYKRHSKNETNRGLIGKQIARSVKASVSSDVI